MTVAPPGRPRHRALGAALLLLFVACAQHGEPAQPPAVVVVAKAESRAVEIAPDAGDYVVPRLSGRVNDFAGKLTEPARARFERELEAFDAETTDEIVVLLLPKLDGHTIEEVAFRTFNTWGIGKRGVNNGVLVVVAIAEKHVRIETGKGLEHTVLPDARAHEIIQTMKEPLRAGAFDDAVEAAIVGLRGALRTGN